MTIGLGLRLALQGTYFIILARVLGANGYGAFAGVASLVSILAPFAGMGGEYLLVKNVARDPARFSIYWMRTLSKIAVGGSAFVLAVIGLSYLVLPEAIPLHLVVFIAVADLLFARVVSASARAFQAHERLVHTAIIKVMLSFARLLGVITMIVFFANPTPSLWAAFYLGAVAVTAVVGVAEVQRCLGNASLGLRQILPEFREGLFFSASDSAQRIYINVDKVMLMRLSGLAPAGIYAAAYRAVDMALVPVMAMLEAGYVRFFQHGRTGVSGTVRFAQKLIPSALVYSTIIGAAIYAVAPLAPLVLGSQYAATVLALRWLAAIPLLGSMRRIAAEVLTGAGRQGWRTTVEGAVVLLNVGLNFWLIPIYSWRGAAWATLASEFMLVISLWALTALLVYISSPKHA